MMMADCSGSASSSNNTLTMSTAHRMRRAGSGGLIGYHTDCSDDDLESSSHSHILDRSKSDMPARNAEEDRRRRTIIVEKKNNSYGFTLQSYGIHYKKEQEIEMITYVDFVEYDGPAYRSGMREGDVILSINGADMEKADHKTLVAFIKGCDTRMRMVVLFENCVRKVELHMRYIQLQTVLQGKMNELERTCLRERELLEGKWKTHSLPARKKATGGTSNCASATADGGDEATSPNGDNGGRGGDTDVPTASPFCRPALSTEDVHQLGRHFKHQHVHPHHQHQHHMQSLGAVIPPPAQFMLTYLDPHCRYVLRPSLLLSSSGGGHHHHHHQHGAGEYYVSVSGGASASGSGRHRRSPEDNPVTNFGSNESTDEILSDAHHSGAQSDHHHSQQRHHRHQHHSSSTTAAPDEATIKTSTEQQSHAAAGSAASASRATKSAGRHCHGGHSCNPCVGHRKDKSSSATNGAAAGGDNVSLDAYDLASPCCDPHCVPTRRRSRHHKDHHHRHKHRDKDNNRGGREDQQRPQRPRSQSHAASPSMLQTAATATSTPHQQGHYNDKCQSHRPRFYDITAGLASHCSLHSCTSSDFGADQTTPLQQSINNGTVASRCMHGGGAESSAASYSTSLSTDTLYWDPESQNGAGNSRQQSTKSRQSTGAIGSGVYHPQTPTQTQQQYVQQQQRFQHHAHAGGQAPTGVAYNCQQSSAAAVAATATYMHGKPKSWDNLAMKGIGGYGFGYGYLGTVNPMALTGKPPPVGATNIPGAATGAKLLPSSTQHQLFTQQQQRHSIPRKNPYGRYSTFSDVENYAPPPSQFVHSTITTTTITKSTENLIGGALNHSNTSLHACDACNETVTGAGVAYVAQMQSMAPSGQPQPKHHDCRGYYSHLPRARVINNATTTDNNGSVGGTGVASGSATNSMPRTSGGISGHVATVSEVTRL